MNFKTAIFDETSRLRSGWRFAAFFLVLVPLVVLLATAGFPIISSLRDRAGTLWPAVNFVYGPLITLIVAIGVGWFCGRTFEQLPFRAQGAWFTGKWLVHLIQGVVIGAVTLLIAVLIAASGGGLSFGFNSGAGTADVAQSLALSLLVFAVAAAAEEAVFRGYPLQTFSRSGYAWLAILITAMFFGLAHRKNPGANMISIVNTMLAGVWFGIAYLKTRDLWFVWGLHLVWNWLQGAIFGIEVSGLTDITPFPVFIEADSGPEWLTGGGYGLEAGIACTVGLVLSTLAIYFLPIVKPDGEMVKLTSLKGEPPS